MSIQDDNTFATKGDLKNLYTNKIAPYLGGGISYYQCDRSGQELKSGQFALALSTSHGTGTDSTINANAIVPFIMQSGNFELGVTTGTFKVPNGMRIEVDVYATVTNGTTTNCHWYLYNATDSKEIDVDNGTNLPGAYLYGGQASNYGMSQSATYQWTNNTGKTVEVGIRNMQSSCKVRIDSTGMTVKEIGRIVDPVKYVSNNSDLQETPVGNIISYMGNTVPKHYLACDGTLYSIGTYPELETFIINEFNSINYFGGDGTSTWAVPDLRGEFLRGTGENSRTNQGSGANVGIHQDGTATPSISAGYDGLYINNIPASGTNGSDNIDSGYKKNVSNRSASVNIAGAWSTTADNMVISRPTNTSVKYCIKYESTYHAFFSNTAYKVSVKASVGSEAELITFDLTDIIGDSTLIANNNTLIAPIDGWYSLGMNWTQDGSENQYYYIRVNDIPTGWDNRIGYANTLYLNKNDIVTIKKQSGASNSGRVNFCLLTSNYNPTIVSADSVYSKNEQMIGYWEDGKPLYQKVLTGNVPTTSTSSLIFDNPNVYIVAIPFCSIDWSSDESKWFGEYPGQLKFYSDANNSKLYLNDQPGGGSETRHFGKPYKVVIQYTKTTDTASTLQIENSLLLNRPDLWEVGTEYHFGGGLYGQRFTGTITSSNGNAYVLGSVSGVTKIVNTGGHVSDSNWHLEIGNYWGSNNYISNIAYQSATNSFRINHYGYINNAYDVWVLYKK